MRYATTFSILAFGAAIWTDRCAADEGKIRAVLVGVGDYNGSELKKLPYAKKDIEGFADALETTGVRRSDMKILIDKSEQARYLPERAKIVRELSLQANACESADTLIVVLNGHGIHPIGDKTSYFCPLDCRLDDRKTWIPMVGPGGILETMEKSRAGRKLLLANACRNDPFENAAQAASVRNFDDFEPEAAPKGVAALFSCRAGQFSYFDKDRGHSLFFDHAIRAWKGEYAKGKKATIENFFTEVSDRVAKDADDLFQRNQNPVVRRSYAGEWVVAAAQKEAEAADDEAPKKKVVTKGKPKRPASGAWKDADNAAADPDAPTFRISEVKKVTPKKAKNPFGDLGGFGGNKPDPTIDVRITLHIKNPGESAEFEIESVSVLADDGKKYPPGGGIGGGFGGRRENPTLRVAKGATEKIELVVNNLPKATKKLGTVRIHESAVTEKEHVFSDLVLK